jgi:hypothetical protein
LANFAKAKKYCHLKRDYRYAFVWLTYAMRMLQMLIEPLEGQHIYLFAEPELVGLYQNVGFAAHDIGLGKVQGKWLVGREPTPNK